MKLNELLKELTTLGTPACGLACGLLGVVLAALLLSVGFWRTLFIVVLCVLGVFLGGVKHKSDFIKGVVNRLFPPKDHQ